MTTAPFTDLHCRYSFASGRSYDDCVYIGRRWRDAYGTTAADSDFWIMVNRPEIADGQTYTRWGPWKNYLTGLWTAPSGVAYVADASMPAIHAYDDVMDHAREARHFTIDCFPEGVWGLNDELVFTWGTRRTASGQNDYPVFRLAQNEFKEMPSPGFAVSAMHGIAPDLIYAAGWQGGLARWDGRAWHRYPLPTGEVMSDVFVAGPDEIYATGHNGALIEGSASGFGIVTRTMDDRLPYTCVAKWNGELWVGGGPQGLFRRVGNTSQLELVKPNIRATAFDVRWNFVITADNLIGSTVDGVNFRGSGINVLQTLTNTIDILED